MVKYFDTRNNSDELFIIIIGLASMVINLIRYEGSQSQSIKVNAKRTDEFNVCAS